MSVIQNAVRGLTTCRLRLTLRLALRSLAVASAFRRKNERRLAPDAAAREHRVGGDELIEAHLGVAQRDAEPVVGRRAVEGGEPGAIEEAQQRAHADVGRERDRGHVLGAGQRAARQERTAILSVVVARTVEHARLRGRKVRRDVGQHGRGMPPLLERERVGERLERGSRLPRHERTVDRAAMVRRRRSRRILPTPATRHARCRARRPRRSRRRAPSAIPARAR